MSKGAISSDTAYDLAHMGDIEGVRAWLRENSEGLDRAVRDGYTLLHIACIFY